MSSTNWSALRRRYYDQKDVIDRLSRFLADAKPSTEYTFDRLSETVHASDRDAFALLLGEVVKRGDLQQVFRVESRGRHGGIGDFNSLREVPASIHDWRTDTQQEVAVDDVVPVYKVG